MILGNILLVSIASMCWYTNNKQKATNSDDQPQKQKQIQSQQNTERRKQEVINNKKEGVDTGQIKKVNIPKSNLPTSNFKYDKDHKVYYGEVFVRGYMTLEGVQEPFCEEDCRMFTRVYFNVVDSSSSIIKEFMHNNNGGHIIYNDKINLGCFKDNQIYLINYSDKNFGFNKTTNATYQANQELVKEMMNSSEDNLITLKLTLYKNTSGGVGAPACYSYFSKFDIAR